MKGGKSKRKQWWSSGWKGQGLWAVDEDQDVEEWEQSCEESGGIEAMGNDAQPMKIETPKAQQHQKAKEFHENPIKICSSTCAGNLHNACAEKSSEISAENRWDIYADVLRNTSDDKPLS